MIHVKKNVVPYLLFGCLLLGLQLCYVFCFANIEHCVSLFNKVKVPHCHPLQVVVENSSGLLVPSTARAILTNTLKTVNASGTSIPALVVASPSPSSSLTWSIILTAIMTSWRYAKTSMLNFCAH